MTERFTVETIDNAWSFINGPDGYREGPYRYRWEAEQYAGQLERGEISPQSIQGDIMTPMQHRALEQVRETGRKGLMVERGWESATQMQLVEDGLLWQEVGERNHWRFTLSRAGEAALEQRLQAKEG